jgi:hypothetical protein
MLVNILDVNNAPKNKNKNKNKNPCLSLTSTYHQINIKCDFTLKVRSHLMLLLGTLVLSPLTSCQSFKT